MAQEFSPTEIFKRATAATLRAIAERDDVTVGFGPEAAGLSGSRVRLPNPPRDLPADEAAQLRGAADSVALRLRYHDDAVHNKRVPGSPLARAAEAPGKGTNWGMAAPSPVLPRGTRIRVGTVGPLDQILNGPSHVTDGTQNLIGALRQSMAALGARTIADMHGVEIVYAPSVVTEGKSWQLRGK